MPKAAKTASLREIADLTGARVIGSAELLVQGLGTPDSKGEGLLGFIRDSRYAEQFIKGECAAALVTVDVDAEGLHKSDPRSRPLLVVPDANLALIKVLTLFAPPIVRTTGVHSTAVVHPTASVDPSASIGAFAFVGEEATIGPNAVIGDHCTIAAGASVGARTLLHPGVRVLDRCEVGSDCILHSGCVLGADGFGFHPAPDGKSLTKIPHIGNVVVHDHVEIGANSCVDRAKFGSTIVGWGTKIDNQVQVGHGCNIGRCCILCGGVGLAGSVVLGDGVQLAGQVGVADNIHVASGTKVAAGSGVSVNTTPGSTVMGFPALPATQYRRNLVAFRMLSELVPKVRKLLGE